MRSVARPPPARARNWGALCAPSPAQQRGPWKKSLWKLFVDDGAVGRRWRVGSGRAGRTSAWRPRARHLVLAAPQRRALPLVRLLCVCHYFLFSKLHRQHDVPPLCAGGWCGGTQQLICIGLVCMVIWHVVVFFASHSAVSMPLGGMDTGSAVDYEDLSSVSQKAADTQGFEWTPVFDRDLIRCRNLEMLTSWKGRLLELTRSEQSLYDSLDCGRRLARAHEEQEPLRRSQQGKKCLVLKRTFEVVPGVSWGKMEKSEDHKLTWSALRCDCYFDRKCKDKVFKTRPPAVHHTTSPVGIKEAVLARRPSERLQPTGARPVVAVVLGATSAKLRFKSLDDNPLFTKLLPSLPRTVTPDYEYWVYVAYDSGDLFYDDSGRLRMLNKWLRRNVARPCRAKEVLVKGIFLNFTNVLRKPGPVFNFAAAAAVHDGVWVCLWVCWSVCW